MTKFSQWLVHISNWDKGVKYLADAGLIRNTVLVLTGSDSVILQQARMIFPGRRGKADKVNFHLCALSFREYFQLVDLLPNEKELLLESDDLIATLYESFHHYLIHGGYLTAINEYAKTGSISISTLDTYAEWIRGDMLKRNRSEHFLREIIKAVIKCYGCQVSWINLSKDLSIDHPKTVSEYIETLQSMDAIFVQQALTEDKLVGAPKKHKKIMFMDPFIYHSMQYWINPTKKPFQEQIIPFVSDPKSASVLIEGVVATHYNRYYPTYYIKAEGEVDVAYVSENKFWPLEVKWTEQLRSSDLKQIAKYPNAKIFAKMDKRVKTQGIPTISIPMGLLNVLG